MKGKIDIKAIAQEAFEGTLVLNDVTYIAKYPYFKDHKYAKNKICLELLKKASKHSEEASLAYKQLAKQALFFKGRTFEGQEDYHIEFKGGKEQSQPMSEDAVVNITTKLGKEICGFLNKDGGSVFVGVHDKTRAIQGIVISNTDLFMLRIQNSILTRMTPNPGQNLHMELHTVQQFSTAPSVESTPKKPENTDEYTAFVESELERMKDHINSLPGVKQEPQLYLLEIKASPTPNLSFYDGVPYIRHNGEITALGTELMKERIIADFLAQNNS